MTTTIKSLIPIRTVPTSEAERAVATIALAFSGDPVARWFWPEAADYLRSIPEFTRLFAGQAFLHGTAWHTEGYTGAALWLGPGVHGDEDALMDYLRRSIAPERQPEIFSFIEQMDQSHPTFPHWYLPMIGVDPGFQRQGLGGALMTHALQRCDRDGLPAYLESSNPENISLYKRHGFEIIGRIQVGTSPVMTPMLRQPR